MPRTTRSCASAVAILNPFCPSPRKNVREPCRTTAHSGESTATPHRRTRGVLGSCMFTSQPPGIRLCALKQLGVVDGDQNFRTFVFEAPMDLAVDISHEASVLKYAWIDPATADMHYRVRVLFERQLVQRFFPEPSEDMIIEEGPAPKPVSSSPQVVQTSPKPVAKGQTFTEILSLNALQYL
eukprot:COSAG01_NODE_29417_length_638_cov_0.769944_1_plen_181_part_10